MGICLVSSLCVPRVCQSPFPILRTTSLKRASKILTSTTDQGFLPPGVGAGPRMVPPPSQYCACLSTGDHPFPRYPLPFLLLHPKACYSFLCTWFCVVFRALKVFRSLLWIRLIHTHSLPVTHIHLGLNPPHIHKRSQRSDNPASSIHTYRLETLLLPINPDLNL